MEENMKLFYQKFNKISLLLGMVLLLASCANTKISQSWVEPDNKIVYKNLLVIGVAESQQNRRAYESNFVESLNELGIKAEASYKIIKSNQKINRETVSKAIEGMNIDGVIITHVLAVDEDTVYRPGYTTMYGTGYYGGGYYGGLYSYYPYVNTYVTTPGYYTTHDTYTIETNLYDVESEELIYSAHTRTFAPDSVEEVIVDMTKLLIQDMLDKKLIDKTK
jgi:hypothetical protein